MVYHVIGRILFPGANCYRLQRSCGQGNIFTPVCHSVHRGESASVHAEIPHPPGADTPQSRHPLEHTHPTGADTRLEQTPPGADTPRADTPPEQTPPRVDTPPEVDTPRNSHPPGADTPSPGSRLRHTVNERPVKQFTEANDDFPSMLNFLTDTC